MRALLASVIVALGLAVASSAAERGTPEEAQAMLARAVEAIRADKTAALAAFNAGDPRFREKDLYVFCGGEDGQFTAHAESPAFVGHSLRNQLDRGGRPAGEEIYRTAVEGEVRTVEYSDRRPGAIAPSWKISYVRKVADQVCAVGYYE